MRSQALLGLVLAAALVACAAEGDDPADAEPTLTRSTPEPDVDDGLLVDRQNGDVFELHDSIVRCMPAEQDPDTELVRLIAAEGITEDEAPRRRDPFLYVEAIAGTTGWFELPLSEREWDKGPSDVIVFGYDPTSRTEVSSFPEASTGTITILEATCDPSPRLAFTIRATLDSELFDLPSLTVVGGMEAGE